MLSQVTSLKKGTKLFIDALLVIGASLLMGLSGMLSFKLPFTDVAFVVQSHVILLCAALLGSKRGTLATLSFLAQGAMGYPVFALGASGLAYLLGPKGGFYLGFALASFLIGLFIERLKEKKAHLVFCSFLVANAAILGLGFIWLSFYIGMKSAFLLGVAPFLLGDVVKCLLVTKAYKLIKSA